MTGRIENIVTLFFYDEIQVFEGRDRIGGHYLGVLVDHPDEAGAAYVIFGISPADLQQLRIGQIELADLMSNISDAWYIGKLTQRESLVVVENPQPQNRAIPQEFLPDRGFLLASGTDISRELSRESFARNSLAFELSVDSTRSQDHQLGADQLGGLLIHVQSLVKHAYKKSVKLRGGQGNQSESFLDVAVPAIAGSFKMLLVPAQLPNLFGGNDISYALEIVDELFSKASDPQATLEHVRKYAGHTANSFLRLLRFLIDANLALEYAWTSPTKEKASSGRITKTQAIPLLALLTSTDNLSVEKLEISGHLRKFDLDAGTWRITTADGTEYSGGKREDVTLSGVIGDKEYILRCEEEIKEVTGTGREVHAVYLVENPIPVVR